MSNRIPNRAVEHALTAVDAAFGVVDIAHHTPCTVEYELARAGRADSRARAAADALLRVKLQQSSEVGVNRIN
jgi:hypothetical protein